MNLAGVAFGHDWVAKADRYHRTLEHLASGALLPRRPTPRRVWRRPCSTWRSIWVDAGHHRGRAAGSREDQRAPGQAGRRGPRFRRLGRGVRGRGYARETAGGRRAVPDAHQPPAEEPAASLQVPGLILAYPGDRMSLRSNAVELARVWRPATLRNVNKVKAAGSSRAGAARWWGFPAPTAAPRRWCGRC